MSKPKPTRADYAKVIAERDQAVADRDSLLKLFVEQPGRAILEGDVLAGAGHLRALAALVALDDRARRPSRAGHGTRLSH